MLIIDNSITKTSSSIVIILLCILLIVPIIGVNAEFIPPIYTNPTIGQCSDEQDRDMILIQKYVDAANNTVEIFCKWNDWLGVDEKQFIGFYNKQVIIGQCPFINGINGWGVEVGNNGVINGTQWTSVSEDGTQSVSYELQFNNNTRAEAVLEAHQHRVSIDTWVLDRLNNN